MHCPSNHHCIHYFPNWSNNQPVVVHLNWLICLSHEHDDFQVNQSRKQMNHREIFPGVFLLLTYGTKCPTWTTLSLIFHGCNDTLITPIDWCRQSDERWCGNVLSTNIRILRTMLFFPSITIQLFTKFFICLKRKKARILFSPYFSFTKVAYLLIPRRYVCKPRSCSILCWMINFTCLAKIWKRWISSIVVL